MKHTATPHTMAEKILMRHTGLSDLKPGDLVVVRPDYAVCHDIYTEKLYKRLQEMNFRSVRYPERLVIFHDHLQPACLPSDPRSLSYGYRLCETYGISDFHPTGGICHQLIPEMGYAKPGRIILCTDSHTTTYGAVGCFSTGIGYTEMADLWGTGELWLRVPASIRIKIEGTLPPHVYAKDIILRVLGDLKAAGGLVNPLDVIEQITYLMFIHDLDDSDNRRAKEAAMLGLPYQSIFADEVQIGERTADGRQLKRSVFHDFPAAQMYAGSRLSPAEYCRTN